MKKQYFKVNKVLEIKSLRKGIVLKTCLCPQHCGRGRTGCRCVETSEGHLDVRFWQTGAGRSTQPGAGLWSRGPLSQMGAAEVVRWESDEKQLCPSGSSEFRFRLALPVELRAAASSHALLAFALILALPVKRVA